MNFLSIFEDRVAGIFGATHAPFSFKKLAKQAAHEMEDQTLVINGVNTAPALYTILIANEDDPLMAPYYPQLSREVCELVKAQAEKKRYVFVGEPLVRFMIDPSLKAGKFSVFAENVDAPTLGRLYEEERAYQNSLSGKMSPQPVAAPAPRPMPAPAPASPAPAADPFAEPDPLAPADPFAPSDPFSPAQPAAPIPVPQTVGRDALAGLGGPPSREPPARPSAPPLAERRARARPVARAGRSAARRRRYRRRPRSQRPALHHRARARRRRRRPSRPQRQPPPRPAHLHRFGLVHRGPQLHQRHARQQPPHHPLPPAQRRPAHLRPEHLRV